MTMEEKYDSIKLILSIFICHLVGFIGSLFSRSAIPEWYVHLNKPGFTPPNWVFAPAWLILYTLMGIALFLVWRRGIQDRNIKKSVVLFGAQLLVNGLWSILFFGQHSPIAGFIDIIILWFLIVFTIISFLRISRLAGLLLVPYLLWVSFATVLNGSILILNQ
jgi:tryptophan-rich sensory protein